MSQAFYTFDSFEGMDIGRLDVDVTSLDLSFRIKKATDGEPKLVKDYGTLVVSASWLKEDTDWGGASHHAEGLADVTLGAWLPLSPRPGFEKGEDVTHRWSLYVGGTIPVGDRDDGFGLDSPTYTVEGLMTWDHGSCSSLRCTRYPDGGGEEYPDCKGCVAKIWPGVANADWQAREAVYPRRQLRFQMGATCVPSEPDLSSVHLRFGALWAQEHVTIEAAADALMETGHGIEHGGVSRDANRSVDLELAVRFRLGTPSRNADAAFYAFLNLRTPIVEDGLDDQFTPTIGVAALFGRLPNHH